MIKQIENVTDDSGKVWKVKIYTKMRKYVAKHGNKIVRSNDYKGLLIEILNIK